MTGIKTATITRGTIENAYNYEEYKELIENLLEKNKTTGENHSESMLHYTKMNVHRMRRLNMQIELKDELVQRLNGVKQPMIWLVLTEGWCGDAAQIVPVIQKMSDQTKMIQVRYILRDENLDIMDQLLTDGRSRSIPKLICLDSQTLEVLGDWGSRPAEAQKLFMDLRASEKYSSRERAEILHKWYADNNTSSVQDEFISLIEEWRNGY